MASSNPIECNTDTINAFTDCLRGDNGLQVGTKEDSSSDTNYVVNFCQNGVEEQSLLYDSELSYNPADATLTSGVLRANAPAASNEPSMTLAFTSDIGRIEARGSDASTVADMQFYVASEAFEVSHNPLNLRGSNGFVGVGRTNPIRELDVLFTTPTTGTSQDTVSALFQTTVGGTGGKHGVGIGGDVVTGNGFLQSTYDDGQTGYNLLLQPLLGNVGVGMTVSPTFLLELGTDSAGKPVTTTWTISSDQRLKTNITPVDKDFLFEKAKQYQVKRFGYIEDYRTAYQVEDRPYIGIIADEVEEYMPCCIEERDLTMNLGTDEDGTPITKVVADCKHFKSTELDYVLKGCVPHLIRETEELRSELAAVQAQYSALLERVTKLESV